MRKKIKWKKEVVTGLLFAMLLAGTVLMQGDNSVVKAASGTEEELQITEDGAWEYEYVTGIEGETEVTVTKYMGTVNDPIIPAEINGYPVTELAKTSFNRNTSLTEVELPDSLIRIDGAAFYGCTGLEKITMPDSIREVGGSAFSECSSLKSVALSASLTELKSSTFSNCTSLKSIWIRDGLEKIENSVFFECTSLESAVIPNSVEDIKFDAFYYCPDLTIYAEENSSGFDYAKNNGIKYVTVNRALYPIHKSEEGWLYTRYWDGEELEIVGYQGNETNVEIPQQLDGYQTKWIAGRIFLETEIESIIFPEGVEKIGEQVCEGCYALKSVTLPETLGYLGDRAFWQCTALTEVTIPAAVTYIGMDAFYQCENLATVNFEKRSSDNELELGLNAFYECDLKRVELPAGVRTLNEYVFYNNESLKEVILPEGVESIGSYCFYGCMSLESVNLPSTVTYIWNAAFMGCQNITEITVLANVTQIGGSAFEGCEELTIYTTEGTEAERYAKENEIPYVLIGGAGDGTASPAPSETPQPSDGTASPAPSETPQPSGGTETPAPSKTPEASKPGNTQTPAGTTPAPGQGTQTQPSTAANGQNSGGTGQTQEGTKKTEVSSVAVVKSFKATAGKRVIVMRWKKVSGALGYQLQISKKKNFAGAKTIKVKKTKKNLNKLKKETVYYLRIRAYAVNGTDGETVYGKWAAIQVRTR